MSTQGHGDGGVYFSTLGPASYDLGSSDDGRDSYEENIIIDCFGKEKLEEYKGKHLLDVVFVYAMNPKIIEHTPGNINDSSKMVSKSSFQTFATSHSGGQYYLRPDFIVGCFLIDTESYHIKGYQEVRTKMDEEKENDLKAQDLLFSYEQDMIVQKSDLPQPMLQLVPSSSSKNIFHHLHHHHANTSASTTHGTTSPPPPPSSSGLSYLNSFAKLLIKKPSFFRSATAPDLSHHAGLYLLTLIYIDFSLLLLLLLLLIVLLFLRTCHMKYLYIQSRNYMRDSQINLNIHI
jgi:hypothetical protein